MALTGTAATMLGEFARRFMGSRHPEDDDRFYDFIIHCHTNNLRVSARDIREFLLASELGTRLDPEPRISDYISIYENGRLLLTKYD